MKLKRKSKQLLKDFGAALRSGEGFYSSHVNLGGLEFEVYSAPKDTTHETVLYASIYCKSAQAFRVGYECEFSMQGFDAACKWLDTQRQQYIEMLL